MKHNCTYIKNLIRDIKFNKRLAEGSIEECYQEKDNEEEANRYEGEVRAYDNILKIIKNDN